MHPFQQQLIPQLRRCIGQTVDYNGVSCAVVEVLEHPLHLVLQTLGSTTDIQSNQFGKPQRRVNTIYTLPCIGEDDPNTLHPALLALGLKLE